MKPEQPHNRRHRQRQEKPPAGEGNRQINPNETYHAPPARSRASVGLLFFAVALFLFQTVSLHAQFYNPGDSTIYLAYAGIRWWEDDSSFLYIFKLKDQGSRIERVSPQFTRIDGMDVIPIFLTGHDNRPSVLYGHGYGLDEDQGQWGFRLVSYDGGENWQLSPGPGVRGAPSSGINYPGENAGESFRLNNGLHYTQSGWETWVSDTTIARDWWGDEGQYTVRIFRQIGNLARYPWSFRAEPSLEFSSDTGRTWVNGDLQGERIPRGNGNDIDLWSVGTNDEFYISQNDGWGRFWCIRDSGRTIQEVFRFSDHNNNFVRYDTVDAGGFRWNIGYIVTTPTPGEFYALIDSTSWDSWGLKLHVYHCLDYGERIVGIYYYFMPDFEPSDPVSVSRSEDSPPVTPLFSVYPNPTNGWVTVYVERGTAAGELRFYDLTGRLCGTKSYTGNTIKFGLQGAMRLPDASGVYILEFRSETSFGRQTVTLIR